MRGRQKRGDFGRRVFSVSAPATGLADIDELDDRGFSVGLNRQIAKECLLLGASHHHVVIALNRLEVSADIATAQRSVQRERFRQALTQRLRVQGLGLVAVANQCGHSGGARYLKRVGQGRTVPRLWGLHLQKDSKT